MHITPWLSNFRKRTSKFSQKKRTKVEPAIYSPEILEDRTLLSAVELLGPGGGLSNINSSVSDDGRFVVFESNATNLVTGQTDTNNGSDIFLLDRNTNTIKLVSHVGNGMTAGNSASLNPKISRDASKIVYETNATNLINTVSDTNGLRDVYIYDVNTGVNSLVSHIAGNVNTTGNSVAINAQISDDGSRVVYESNADNLVAGATDNNGTTDVYLYDVSTTLNKLVSHVAGTSTAGNSFSLNPKISGDSGTVVYETNATNLVSGVTDTNNTRDVYEYDVLLHVNKLVSHTGTGTTTANSMSTNAQISFLGNRIAYETYATNILNTVTDTNAKRDIYSYDSTTETNTLVSHVAGNTSTTANAASINAQISDSGLAIVYESNASNLEAGATDNNGTTDIYLYNATTTLNKLVSHVFGTNTAANAFSLSPKISGDGNTIVYETNATNLVIGITDSNNTRDVYKYDVSGGSSHLISQAFGSLSTGNAYSGMPYISGGGNLVTFLSDATNLIAVDVNGQRDLYGYELAPASGRPTADPNGPYTAQEGVPITLDGSGSSDNEDSNTALTFEWDLDNDGQFDDATGEMPTVTFPDGPATQIIGLKVTDTDNNSDIGTTVVNVENVAPNLTIDDAVVTVVVGSTATNTGTWSDVPADTVTITASIGTVTQNINGTWSWSLDTTGFPNPSTQTVTVTATDDDQESTTKTFTLNIESTPPPVNNPPTADANGPYIVNEGSPLTLDGSGSSDPDESNATLTFEWDLDNDGQFDDATGETPTFTFPDGPLVQTIHLKVTDSGGLSSVDTTTVSISNVPPFIVADNPVVTVNIGDTASNTGIFGDVGDDDVTLSASQGTPVDELQGNWSWSDTFNTLGSFTIMVTATDSDGDLSTTSFTVNVIPPNVELVGRTIEICGLETDDTVNISRDGNNIVVVFNNQDPDVFAIADVDKIDVDLKGGNDKLIIDYSNGFLLGNTEDIVYEGGSQNAPGGDSLEIIGGSFAVDSVTHTFTNANDGSVNIVQSSTSNDIIYTGLEPIVDNLLSTDRIFNFAATDDAITLGDDGVTGNNISRISSLSSSETVTFLNPTGSLVINAGDGSDTVSAAGAVDLPFGITVNGQGNNDFINGSLRSDTLNGDGGNDSLFGGSGDDYLNGGNDNDLLIGNSGNDKLNGSFGDDYLVGGSHNDLMFGGSGDDTLFGNDGNDQIYAQGTNNYAEGGSGNDSIIGGQGADTLLGDAGNDNIDGLVGNDTINGGANNDSLEGGDGNDTIDGGGGNDNLLGENGNDSLIGSDGDDTLVGAVGDDTLDGGTGDSDLVFERTIFAAESVALAGNTSSATLKGGPNGTGTNPNGLGDNLLIDIEKVYIIGGSGDNLLDASATSQDVTLQGAEGNDTLYAGSGNDALSGYTGNDKLNGSQGNDTLIGGDGNDSLFGGSGDDIALGGDDDDLVRGQAGMDTVAGNDGFDNVHGASGPPTDPNDPGDVIDESFTFMADWIDFI